MRGVVAVVDDDEALCTTIVRVLRLEGFDVAWSAATGRDAIRRAAGSVSPDALILDVALPDTDGRDLLGALRSRGVAAPALLLSAKSSVADKVLGFGAGADDYLTKPFVIDELLARLDVLVRRASGAAGTEFALDPVRHVVAGPSGACPLSPTEYRLLAALVSRRGEVVRRASLISSAWPPGSVVRENTLDSYVARLRRALRDVGSHPSIATARGVGYRLD
ncbi:MULTISPECIES: response regulator transcription factor [unclassified Pseudofrankia]|uniref:response regulator transcription factor n=1 Tax=unclassified Pseudofrankia TaxID=2994372 RepID=UPI0008D93711|nr:MULTISPECIES: response regulator transcription factor [unclassified Pseudofrankia]MDT3439557.1 response regulator transcription factor [Pseudofrankia sp. BMG5.37]OHV48774.1 DNA-binding response regulator [Pseudofrankia sp. BMG5.36]